MSFTITSIFQTLTRLCSLDFIGIDPSGKQGIFPSNYVRTECHLLIDSAGKLTPSLACTGRGHSLKRIPSYCHTHYPDRDGRVI